MPNENGEYTQEEAQELATKIQTLETEVANSKATLENSLVLPKEGATQEQISAVMAVLGAVTKPEDLAEVVKDDKAFDALKPVFVKAGLTKAQVKEVYEGYMNYANEQITAIATKNKTEVEALQKEWGADWDANIASAKAIVGKLGIDKVGLNQLEASIGSANMLKMFHTVSKASVEPEIKGGEAPGGAGSYIASNPADAQEKINALMKDPAFAKKLAEGDKEATKQFNDLHKVRYGGGK